VRMLAATHRDIKSLVGSGQFREDLYYRLAGYQVDVPALRKRPADIPLLVEHFRRRVATEMHRDPIAGPSQAVLDVFAGHDWPGNVRELEQVIRRTVIDAGSLTDAEAAKSALRTIAPHTESTESPSDEETGQTRSDDLIPLDEAERNHIMTVLRATGGNQTQAAFILGIERKTLARKIKRLDIAIEKT
jgi:DNA-binding NtrC family response regulator